MVCVPMRMCVRERKTVKGACLLQKVGQSRSRTVDGLSHPSNSFFQKELKSSFKNSFFQQSFERLSVAIKSVSYMPWKISELEAFLET